MISRRARLLRVAVLAVVIGLSVSQIYFTIATLPQGATDADAYWNAAVRLRQGEPLYVPGETVLANDVYRYAPWFAFLWLPFTHLPREPVLAVWTLAMVIGVGLTVLPALRSRSLTGVALALLIGWVTLQTALYGNVQPALTAALVYGVERRSGPMWIGLAASLKLFPILFVLVYAARGERSKAAATLGIAAVLLAPMLLFDLSGYTSQPGDSISLYAVSVPLWVLCAAVACGVSIAAGLRDHPASWLAAAAAVILASPQTHVSYGSYLMVGVADGRRVRGGSGGGARPP